MANIACHLWFSYDCKADRLTGLHFLSNGLQELLAVLDLSLVQTISTIVGLLEHNNEYIHRMCCPCCQEQRSDTG